MAVLMPADFMVSLIHLPKVEEGIGLWGLTEAIKSRGSISPGFCGGKVLI